MNRLELPGVTNCTGRNGAVVHSPIMQDRMSDSTSQRPTEKDRGLDAPEELQNLQEIASYLRPSTGDLPTVDGIDMFGVSLPLHGTVGGDHIIYLDFKKRYDLDARIANVEAAGNHPVAEKLRLCRRRAGVVVADVSGHFMTDALVTFMLHQAFLLGAIYELDLHGEITTRLFENLNKRFYQSSAVHKYVTLLYGEIGQTGTFRFITAGHSFPVVFSRHYDRIVGISEESLSTFPPIGTMPSSQDIDLRATETTPLGYKESYTANEISLMGNGDILVLYTDGLSEHQNGGQPYFPGCLEACLREGKDRSARELCDQIVEDVRRFGELEDDLTLVLIKRL